jgi:PAS domain S-box-containing protein
MTEAACPSRLGRFQESLATVVATLPQPIFIVDRDLMVQYYNWAASRILKLPDGNQAIQFDTIITPAQKRVIRQQIASLINETSSLQPNNQLILKVDPQIVELQPDSAMLTKVIADDGEPHVLIAFDKAPVISTPQFPKLHLGVISDSSQLMEALDSLPDSIVVFDSDWRYVFVNKAGWKRLARPKTEVLGENVWELNPKLNNSDYKKEAYRSMSSGQRATVVEYYPHNKLWYETTFYPAENILVAQMKDITEAKSMKILNEHLTEGLDNAMSNLPRRGYMAKPRKSEL